jgi:hypothetical protein
MEKQKKSASAAENHAVLKTVIAGYAKISKGMKGFAKIMSAAATWIQDAMTVLICHALWVFAAIPGKNRMTTQENARLSALHAMKMKTDIQMNLR